MDLSRREFLAGATAFALLREGFAAAAPRADLFEGRNRRAADFLICRRLHLDICGRLPTPDEVRAFVGSSDRQKVGRLVDALLATEDFADYWSMRYCDILRVKSEFPINLWPNAVYVYHRWIRNAILKDMPWDAFAQALLMGRGSNFRVPESNFLRATAMKTPEGLSTVASETFLLAPTEKYARYFSRVAWKPTREWKEEIVYLKDGPRTDTPGAFAELLTGPLAAEFHAAPVRRVHWWVFGSLPKADRLGEWRRAFERGGLRLKPLLRHVFTSSAYLAGPIRGRFPARRLDAEVLDDALASFTHRKRDFQSIAPEPYTFLPPLRKSVLIEDGSISNAFLLRFGRPSRDAGTLEERKNEITAKQRLYLLTSATLWKSLGNVGDDIESVFLRLLSRPPTREEAYLAERHGLTGQLLSWYIVNSREFLYRI